MTDHRRWLVDVPPNRCGRWYIERYRVGLGEQTTLTELLGGVRPVVPGTYTRLVADGADVWMSDTDAEFHDHAPVLNAQGRVLITGLGLGILPNWLLQDPEVEHIDIVEIDSCIISLVAPWLAWKWGGRVTVHHGDAFSFAWPPGARWDVAWHDIWIDISISHLREMDQLMGRYADRASFQECWGRPEILERLSR